MNNVHVEADDNMECKLFGKLDCSGICSNESGMKLKKLLLSASILMYLVTFVAIGLMYAYFPSDCAFNTGATTVTVAQQPHVWRVARQLTARHQAMEAVQRPRSIREVS